MFWYNREHQDFKDYQESEDCLVFLAHLDHRELVEYQVFQELKYTKIIIFISLFLKTKNQIVIFYFNVFLSKILCVKSILSNICKLTDACITCIKSRHNNKNLIPNKGRTWWSWWKGRKRIWRNSWSSRPSRPTWSTWRSGYCTRSHHSRRTARSCRTQRTSGNIKTLK